MTWTIWADHRLACLRQGGFQTYAAHLRLGPEGVHHVGGGQGEVRLSARRHVLVELDPAQ